ncbi:MAG: hypothetical protein IM600_18630 [Bacteroidetes bacterium]|nr:hypothetical protein [Bacteroidota bacterium]
MRNLTIAATTTNSYNELTAIKQILLGYINAPLVNYYFPNGWDNLGNLSIDMLNSCFKKLNDKRK